MISDDVDNLFLNEKNEFKIQNVYTPSTKEDKRICFSGH